MFFMLLFSLSIFSDRWSVKTENENNRRKILTAEAPYTGQKRVQRDQCINLKPYPGWLELSLN